MFLFDEHLNSFSHLIINFNFNYYYLIINFFYLLLSVKYFYFYFEHIIIHYITSQNCLNNIILCINVHYAKYFILN